MNEVEEKGKNKQIEVSDSGKNKLDLTQKNTVLRWIAVGNTSKEVAKLVEDKYGIDISRQAIDHYKNNYKDEIYEIRKGMNQTIKRDIGIANKSVRIRKLKKAANMALSAGNITEFRLTLKQVAEELGEMENSVIVKGEMNNIVNQLLLVIQNEVKDEETLQKIGERLQKEGVNINE